MTLSQKAHALKIAQGLKHYQPTASRQPDDSVGMAVARRTVFRDSDEEDWVNVAKRVATGNASLHPTGLEDAAMLVKAIASMALLTSGRHLQHGDIDQHKKNMELFTNCATANTCSTSYYLLLNGSGVGRCYDEELLPVDWQYCPDIHCLLDEGHQDFAEMTAIADEKGLFTFGPVVKDDARYTDDETLAFDGEDSGVRYFKVPDSRAGLAEALVFLEVLTHQNTQQGKMAVSEVFIDFSDVRPKGSPIKGMQGRPSNGPVALIEAFDNINTIAFKARVKGTPVWLQNMLVDHYMAESVVVGGSRRSSRIAVMHWKSPHIFDFIGIKKKEGMWSANNSVGLDAAFYKALEENQPHATRVMQEILTAQYFDKTGEPGFLNLHKLSTNSDGLKEIVDNMCDFSRPALFGNEEFYIKSGQQRDLYADVYTRCYNHHYHFIVNPCGEIVLSTMGGFCVIADMAPYFCETLAEVLVTAKLATRFLIRTNLMPSIYSEEVKRTNRIGVALTGMFEFAWKFFKLTPDQLLDEHGAAESFWTFIALIKRTVKEEAARYSNQIGVAVPHTDVCFKPSGTVSKIPFISEGAGLPTLPRYLRWVQFQHGDVLIDEHEEAGYPVVRHLKTYKNTSIVGYPVEPEIFKIGMPEDAIRVATDWGLENHFTWLRLLEKHYIHGTDAQGEALPHDTGNQISYTAKYDPEQVSFEEFSAIAMQNWPAIKCATVMPVMDATAYEYQPEQPISHEEFAKVVSDIKEKKAQTITLDELQCDSGACPI